MPSLGIVSLINRLIVALLAGLGPKHGEWVTPLGPADRLDRI